MIRKILLSLPIYPDTPPPQTLEGAALLAQFLGASLTAQIPQLSSDPATWSTVIGVFPLDFPRLMDETVVLSEKNAGVLTEALSGLCSDLRGSLDIRTWRNADIPSRPNISDLALHLRSKFNHNYRVQAPHTGALAPPALRMMVT